MFTLSQARRTLLTVCPLTLSTLALGSSQNVWFVGGEPGDHETQISTLLASGVVADGDTIQVRPGMYDPFDLGTLQDLKLERILSPGLDPDLDANRVIISDPSPTGSGIVIAGGQDADTVIDGFTVRDFQVTHSGGGMRIEGSSPTLRDCSFQNNQADKGAGVYVTGLAPGVQGPRFESCDFTQNQATASGGGVAVEQAHASVVDCVFENNTALGPGNNKGSGGAIFVDNITFAPTPLPRSFDPVTLNLCVIQDNISFNGAAIAVVGGPIEGTDTQFVSNEALNFGGAVYLSNLTFAPCSTPGLFCDTPRETSVFQGCTFSSNQAVRGACVAAENDLNVLFSECKMESNTAGNSGGAVYARMNARVDMAQCQLRNNSARRGGAIYLADTIQSRFANTLFQQNSAPEGGGAVALVNPGTSSLYSPELFDNCLFVQNQAPSSFRGGGAIYVESGSPRFQHCTFADNATTGEGGAIYFDNTFAPADIGTPRAVSCIFANNTSADSVTNPERREIVQYPSNPAPMVVEFCFWQDHDGMVCTSCQDPMIQDPQFLAGPTTLAEPVADYFLNSSSEAIDLGRTDLYNALAGTTSTMLTLDTFPSDAGYHYRAPARVPQQSTLQVSSGRIEAGGTGSSGIPTRVRFDLHGGANRGTNQRHFALLGCIPTNKGGFIFTTEPGITLSSIGGPQGEVLSIDWQAWTQNMLQGSLPFYGTLPAMPSGPLSMTSTILFDQNNDGREAIYLDFSPASGLTPAEIPIFHGMWIYEDVNTLVPSSPSQFHELTVVIP